MAIAEQLESAAFIMDHASDAIIGADAQLRLTIWNRAAEAIYGWRTDEVLGKQVGAVIPVLRFLDGQTQAAVEAAFALQDTWRGEVLQRAADGRELYMDVSVRLVRDAHGMPESYLAVGRDCTERKKAEAVLSERTRELEQQRTFLQLMQDVAVAANAASDVEAAMQTCLDLVCAYTGWPIGHAFLVNAGPSITLRPMKVWHVADHERFSDFQAVTELFVLAPGEGLPGRVFQSGEPAWVTGTSREIFFTRAKHARQIGIKAGCAFPVLAGTEVVAVMEFFATEWCEPDAQLLEAMRHVGTQLGWVMERARTREHLARFGWYDPLTGLPNRSLFMDRLQLAMKRKRRRKSYIFAVLFLDLDRFKAINDSLGHHTGDQLLIAVARRLEACLRSGDTIARLGGDEFAVLLDDLQDAASAQQIAQRFLDACAMPFDLDGDEVSTTPSIGIALGSPSYDRPDDLLRDADTAMYRAKAAGKGRYEVFERRT